MITLISGRSLPCDWIEIPTITAGIRLPESSQCRSYVIIWWFYCSIWCLWCVYSSGYFERSKEKSYFVSMIVNRNFCRRVNFTIHPASEKLWFSDIIFECNVIIMNQLSVQQTTDICEKYGNWNWFDYRWRIKVRVDMEKPPPPPADSIYFEKIFFFKSIVKGPIVNLIVDEFFPQLIRTYAESELKEMHLIFESYFSAIFYRLISSLRKQDLITFYFITAENKTFGMIYCMNS